ncbi:tRNA (guanosine(46)-N(7))-methyltransferase TrmB [Magnetospirillum sp. UT-4]|uniref:tRNA (guanine(46)-N(7))-methyltransferase TrmB n=1 Tax=Magnetospirillum sp. UT-4 TaxID=2681467 RepID=UPI001382CEB5|nr:tRNA (guanine(46)-N(7))-methyltransferase TrmB [Magnetospirillum sp. UT-4]CAA7624479.1 tRNA (guanine-N(7)-)-methyltransferase [Magnetospirillum sp. UT-4]
MAEDTEETRAGDRPRFFGRRRGKKLRQSGLDLLDAVLPGMAVPLPAGPLDPFALFPVRPGQVWLEVGFGGGEHVVAQAALNPEIGLIGCEPFRNGIASLLAHLPQDARDRVRIFADDARLLLPALPEASIGRAFVLFPDPWPKKRHAERRFIGPANLDALARVLAAGAELRVASDDPVYQDWAGQHLAAHPLFEEVQVTRDRATLPDDWPPTRYEQKCITGNAPVFFRYRRKTSPG